MSTRAQRHPPAARRQQQMDLRLDTLSLDARQHSDNTSSSLSSSEEEEEEEDEEDDLSASSDFETSESSTTTATSPSRESFYTPSTERRHVRWSTDLVEIINQAEKPAQSHLKSSSSVMRKLRSPFVRMNSFNSSKEVSRPEPKRMNSYYTRKPSRQNEQPRTSSSW